MILVAAAYIALVIAAAYFLLRALEVFAPNAARGWFGQVAEDNEADASRLDALDFNARGSWEDHPARRADVAKTRRQEAGRRDMERIWRDSMGGGSDAA